MIGDTAVFEISVHNGGGGRVLSPYADISNCGESNLDYDDLDRVSYSVEMTGGSLVSCTPSDGILRLSNDVGKIVCTFNIIGTTAYETPLIITLDYKYMDSTQKSVQVIATPWLYYYIILNKVQNRGRSSLEWNKPDQCLNDSEQKVIYFCLI